MSGMTSERLAEVREDHGNASDDTGLTYSMAADQWHVVCDRPTARFLMWAHRDLTDLLAHVDHLTAENARLRDGIAELVSVGYSHTPDCEANEWQRVAYGGHPDCGLCWEDKLATLLNPPTEGEADE